MISSIMYKPIIQNSNFTVNNFYSEFASSPTITATVSNMPKMQGSGLVRDVREAMSFTDAAGNLTAPASALQT
jgi:hypothetical protein